MNRKQWQMVEELRQENKEMKEELVKLKADWDTAPEWAVKHLIESFYIDEYNQTKGVIRIEERRPEVKE